MKVVVLAGGISTERDVSLISGKMIYQAMKRLGHQAVLLDVFLGMERDDIDHIFESDEDFSAGIEAIHEINPDISAVKALRKDGGKCYFGPNVIKICQMADVVFLGLHGADGEGGKVQAAFCWESATPAQTLSAARWRWISALQKNCLCKTGFRPLQASV